MYSENFLFNLRGVLKTSSGVPSHKMAGMLIVACLMILSPGRASSVPDSVALENEYFRVMRNSTGCATAQTKGFGARVIVALGKMNIKSSRGAVALERGQISVFLPEESYDPPAGDFFEVAFKADHPPLKVPEEWIEPLKTTTVYENENFRVFEERLAPGDDRELHSHA